MPGKNVVAVEVGDVVDMTEKRVKELNDGSHTVTLDIRSESLSQTIRLYVNDPENWMYETRGKIVEITRVERSIFRMRNGGFFNTDLVKVTMEKTDEKPNLVSLLVQDHVPPKKERKPADVKMPALAPEKAPKPVEKPKPKKDSEKPFGIGLDSFLDALHDEDLSGVKATDEELPFN